MTGAHGKNPAGTATTSNTAGAVELDVWMDIVCPWCHLGQHRLDRALARQDRHVRVRFHPFQLQPDMPPGGVPRRASFAQIFGSEQRADAAFARVAAVGAAEGVEFRFDLIATEPNTLDAHRLISVAQAPDQSPERGRTVVRALTDAYFRHGADLTSTDTLIDITTRAGLPQETARAALADPRTANRIRAAVRDGARRGVTSVPTYHINRNLITGAVSVEELVGLFDNLPSSPSAS